uniref:RRM domain-containing protein n=1 Tax=Globisporangium ultimum (strain ATCC 200006 / CBS 805.95 / DAOM BR144) TaxID=431595 RepID=K3WQA0_GLOUD
MGTRVYVGGLPRDATSREIQDGFSRYGHVSNIWVARNPPGFAFVHDGAVGWIFSSPLLHR